MCIQNVCCWKRRAARAATSKEKRERVANVIGISISEDKQQPGVRWTAACSGPITASRGDRFAGPGERQVSLFSAKAKQLLEQSEQGQAVFQRFGGNFLTQGLDFL